LHKRSVAIGGFSAFGKMRRRCKPVARAVIGSAHRDRAGGNLRVLEPPFPPHFFLAKLLSPRLLRGGAPAPKGRIWRTDTGREAAPIIFLGVGVGEGAKSSERDRRSCQKRRSGCPKGANVGRNLLEIKNP
jgi:hypothetical protein